MSRVNNDFYPTPDDLSLALVQFLKSKGVDPNVIVESSAGTGSFVRAVKKVWSTAHVAAIEIDPNMESALRSAGADWVYIGDWMNLVKTFNNIDALIVGNDPFQHQITHITAGLQVQANGAWHAKLGRASLLGSRERVPFWENYPPRYVVPLTPRPNFMKGVIGEDGKKKGGDNSEYMFYVWQKGYTGPSELCRPLVWR